MRSQSLLSQLSNLSQISNVSYRAQKQEYSGSQFFKQSLPFSLYTNVHANEVKLEYAQLEGSEIGLVRNFSPPQDCLRNFSSYWASSLCQNIEGTSDNENEPEMIKKQPDEVKEEPNQSQNEFLGGVEKKQSSFPESEKKNIKNNETKNIPKNYGKAIIIFFERSRESLEKVLEDHEVDYDQLLLKLKSLKKKINTISDLKNVWQEHAESKALRVISNYFLRKHSLHYIYNSRIKTRLCHAKYKRRLQEAIINPREFNYIKDY